VLSSLKTDENLNVVREIPLDRLMLETDAPWCDIRPSHSSSAYLPPKTDTQAWRPVGSVKKEKFVEGIMVKGRNEPCMLRAVAQVVAKLKNVSEQELAENVYTNTMRLFFAK
jgi:TatD DNase family protein